MSSWSSSSFPSSSSSPPPATTPPLTPPRPRAASRSSSAFQGPAVPRTPYIHHHKAASTPSVFQLMTSSTFPIGTTSSQPTISRQMPPSASQDQVLADSPRFSRLLTSVLGSPFLTTSDLPSPTGDDQFDYRPSSSRTHSIDFSIIDIDPDDPDSTNASIPGGYPASRSRHWASHSRSFSSSVAGVNISRGSSDYSGAVFPGSGDNESPTRVSLHGAFKSLLPRIWDVISSPGRAVLNLSPTSSSHTLPSSSPSSSRAGSPSPRRALTPLSQSWYHPTAQDTTPVASHKGKGKSKAITGFFSRNSSRADLNHYVNYSELPPLDDDEGELIDDEACFIDVRAITGIDIMALLPPELALHILMLLCPCPLDLRHSSCSGSASGRSAFALSSIADQEVAIHAILACRSVSHTWRRLASDNAVWRALFVGRWGIDLERATPEAMLRAEHLRSGRKGMGHTWDYDWGTANEKRRYHPTSCKRSLYLSRHRISYITSENTNAVVNAPLQLDWRLLYRERLELDMRWSGSVLIHDRPPTPYQELSDSSDFDMRESKENIKPWEPQLRRMEGHSDSVYCLEFDSQRIMTGSRDRTIKVWSLKTGQVLGTFRGVHKGSVLCLKFERDWDRCRNASSSRTGEKKGTLVTGSSDCSICVWDLELGDIIPGSSDREVKAEVRATLKGHDGGVLDLRMDDKWIVSCSKDASIRVWDRDTLESVRVLRGHEGPVNAIGFQDDKVVSASGDGKMILWNIANGERIRTFEGHDRGLACIEFKDNLIVSGSNDCKIKVWDPWTGECLRTLVGHDALVRALSFDPRSGRLVSVSYDKAVKVWDLRSGKLVREFKKIHSSHIFDVKFDATRIVTTSHDHQIIELDFSGGLDTSLFI